MVSAYIIYSLKFRWTSTYSGLYCMTQFSILITYKGWGHLMVLCFTGRNYRYPDFTFMEFSFITCSFNYGDDRIEWLPTGNHFAVCPMEIFATESTIAHFLLFALDWPHVRVQNLWSILSRHTWLVEWYGQFVPIVVLYITTSLTVTLTHIHLCTHWYSVQLIWNHLLFVYWDLK